jgi:spore maturation protein CgeB
MNIAFWGSSLVSAYWNGAATYYRGILRSLANLGYQTTFYEPNAYDRQRHRDIDDPAWARIVVYDPDDSCTLEQCLRESGQADVVVKASGVGVLDEFLENRISRMAGGVCRVFWDVDAPATLDRMAANATDPFRTAVPKFDVIFTYGGGDPVVNGYAAFGAKLCVPVYNALDPDVHHPVPAEERFSGDISFLGNRLPDREARVEEFFLKAAAISPAHKFILGGSGWGDKSVPSNVNYIGHVYTAGHNAFNCSARAVLNISRESMARYGYSPATRVFEAAGGGACLITDYWEGIDQFLTPETEVLVAHNGGDVSNLLQTLTWERAHAIGDAARQRVLRDHTYQQRGILVHSTLTKIMETRAANALLLQA